VLQLDKGGRLNVAARLVCFFLPPTDGPDHFASFEEVVDNRTVKNPGEGHAT
jgi:hypothetical protein